VLSGRGLCDYLITHTVESYGLWCVVVCNLETWPTGGGEGGGRGLLLQKQKQKYVCSMFRIRLLESSTRWQNSIEIHVQSHWTALHLHLSTYAYELRDESELSSI
jgi:hypothetical protein